MNFSPQNDQSLLGLVAALKAGMDPSTAYNVYGDIYSQQAQQIANRQQRLTGLSDLLLQNAQAGVDYQGAQAIAEAAPGPAGPAVQNMLSTLYPQGDEIQPAPPMSASGQPVEAPPGYYSPQGYGQTATSPTMPPPPPPSMGEQVQAGMLQQQQMLEPLWAELAQNAGAAAAEGKTTREQFIHDAMQAYPELFGSDIQTAQQIILTAFAQSPTGA